MNATHPKDGKRLLSRLSNRASQWPTPTSQAKQENVEGPIASPKRGRPAALRYGSTAVAGQLPSVRDVEHRGVGGHYVMRLTNEPCFPVSNDESSM